MQRAVLALISAMDCLTGCPFTPTRGLGTPPLDTLYAPYPLRYDRLREEKCRVFPCEQFPATCTYADYVDRIPKHCQVALTGDGSGEGLDSLLLSEGTLYGDIMRCPGEYAVSFAV